MTRALPHLVAALLALATAAPASAIVEERPRWFPTRRPGGALVDDPIPPSGWRVGVALASPWATGLSFGYVWPAAPVGVKLGATWGVWNAAGWSAWPIVDARAYGALLYYLVPAYAGGPYLEAGLGVARSSGGVTALPWPALPHVGVGTSGRWGDDGLGWDVNFTGVANGLVTLEGAVLF